MSRSNAITALAAVQEPPRPPAFPRTAELAKAMAILVAAAALGMATARLRFQVVDWGVESRDLQTNLRRAESEAAALRRDVARLKSPARLTEIAETRLGLAKLPPETVLRLPITAQRVQAWQLALEKASRLGGFEPTPSDFDAFADSLAPVAEMIRRDSGHNDAGRDSGLTEAGRESGQSTTGKEEKQSALAALATVQHGPAEGIEDDPSLESQSEAPAEIIARRLE
jgi:cell division protein FtsL